MMTPIEEPIVSNRSRTSFLSLIAFCVFIVAGCGEQETAAPPEVSAEPAAPPSQQTYADSVFHGGRIYTVDEDRSWAQAVAIKDGKFLEVGENANVLELVGPDTKQYDLEGAVAIPGLFDSHFHTQSADGLLDCTPGQFRPEQLEETLEYCKSRRVEGYPWLIINGMEMWDGSLLHNDLLNEIFPDIPVVIRDVSYHTRLVNAKALEVAGIDRNTSDPEGGKILRHPETGEPTGVLAEGAAIELVAKHIPPYAAADLERAVVDLFQALVAQGITHLQDAALDEKRLSLLARVDRDDVPMPYILGHIVWTHLASEEERQSEEETIENRSQFQTRHLSVNGVKGFLDGVPVPPAFTHVPIGPDGEVDETNLLVPRDVLAQKLIEWDQSGLKVKMHAAGEGAVRVGLDAIEALRKVNGDGGTRHEIGHTSDVSATDLPRFAQLNATAEVSPYFWHLGGMVGGTGYQFRSLHDNDALITIGSDYAVVESFNPFPPLQGIVEREGESVPIATALEFVTRNAALSVGRLDEMGSIEAGKIAIMIVLDRNLLEIPSGEIGETKVLKTILDGEVVYASGI